MTTQNTVSLSKIPDVSTPGQFKPDHEAWNELVPRLLLYVGRSLKERSQLHSLVSAEDIVQLVVTKFLDGTRKSGATSKKGFYDWLCSSAKSEISNLSRTHEVSKRNTEEDVLRHAIDGSTPYDEVNSLESYTNLFSNLAGDPQLERLAKLSLILGLRSTEEIATAMELPSSAVTPLKRRLRRFLSSQEEVSNARH